MVLVLQYSKKTVLRTGLRERPLWLVLLLIFLVIGFSSNACSEEEKKEGYYAKYDEARKKAKEKAKKVFPKKPNPHDQINDLGEIQLKVCLYCHKDIPDLEKELSIDEVTFRYDKFDDLEDLCFTCHPERMHPGGGMMGGADSRWEKFGGAPNHLQKPDGDFLDLMEYVLTERYTIAPLDPKTGKITCVTCHNPHERGVLAGSRGDVGADTEVRLRTDSAPLCLICHEVTGKDTGVPKQR